MTAPSRWPALLGVAALTSLVAAVAGTGALALGLPPWAMFLGWAGFFTGGGATREGAYAAGAMLVGVVLAMTTVGVLSGATAALGLGGVALTFFAVTLAALLVGSIPGLRNVLAIFLGVTAFFASRLPAAAATFVVLAAAIAIGACVGAASVQIERRLAPRG